MPSGQGYHGTGSDTRLYNPKSQASHMYTANSEDEESYRHGIGDPEEMERRRDQKQAERDNAEKVTDLPHLRLETVEPKPELPPGMEEEMEQDQPIMDDDNENAVGAEISQMTGMPGQGGPNASAMFGAQVNQPYGQQTLATGEPMADAWSSLMKEYGSDKDPIREQIARQKAMSEGEAPRPYGLMDYKDLADMEENAERPSSMYTEQAQRIFDENAARYRGNSMKLPEFGNQYEEMFTPEFQDANKGEPIDGAWSSLMKDHKPWVQPQMETTPFGRSKSDKISEIRGKRVASAMGHPADKGGLNEAPLALHRGHRQTTQPVSLFPEKYQQTLGQHASRRLMGGIEMPKGMQPRPTMGERPKGMGKPTPPKMPKEMAAPKMPAMPKEPSMKLASIDSMKKDIQLVRKKMDYMQFNQLRALLRRLKNKVDDRRLKMADPGGVGEAGPGDGTMSTNPQGGTESIQADEAQHGSRSDGAGGSGKTFGRKGSGRVA